jgi:hypothetical protein
MVGQYHPGDRVCELYVGWVQHQDVPPEAVASAIIHEAEHARLLRLGFKYTPELQLRIERMCHRAERIFGKRLPDGAAVITQAEEGMKVDDAFYDREQRLTRERAALEELAATTVLIKPVVWFYDARAWLRRRRAAQQGMQRTGPALRDGPRR